MPVERLMNCTHTHPRTYDSFRHEVFAFLLPVFFIRGYLGGQVPSANLLTLGLDWFVFT